MLQGSCWYAKCFLCKVIIKTKWRASFCPVNSSDGRGWDCWRICWVELFASVGSNINACCLLKKKAPLVSEAGRICCCIFAEPLRPQTPASSCARTRKMTENTHDTSSDVVCGAKFVVQNSGANSTCACTETVHTETQRLLQRRKKGDQGYHTSPIAGTREGWTPETCFRIIGCKHCPHVGLLDYSPAHQTRQP